MATYPSLLFVVLPFTLSTLFFCGISSNNNGFSVQLIHRDSPNSPFYKPNETHFQRITNAFLRSQNRLNRFYPQINGVAGGPSDQGDYLMRYSVGTPPVQQLGVFDTGSDLVWTRCKPCKFCSKQTTPMFDPKKSTTYKANITCGSELCQSIFPSSCYNGPDIVCEYYVEYGDKSFTDGDLAFETITLPSTTGQSISFPNIPFGCGTYNSKNIPPTVSGVVGFGGGLVSLATQIGPKIGSKFSYCLVPSKTTLQLNFGQNAVVSDPGTVSTPIVPGPVKTFYYLTLEGISVGPKRINFVSNYSNSAAVNNGGNIVIDSGATVSLLPKEFYDKLESDVAAHIKLAQVKNQMMSLCYNATPQTINAPVITAHFVGANVVLSAVSTFVSVSNDVVCFAFAPAAKSGGGIFGSLAQVNHLVGYDLQKKIVSFKPTDCSKLQ